MNKKFISYFVIALILLLGILRIICSKPDPATSVTSDYKLKVKDSVVFHDSVIIRINTITKIIAVPRFKDSTILVQGIPDNPSSICSDWSLNQYFTRSDSGWYHLMGKISCNPPLIKGLIIEASPVFFTRDDTDKIIKSFFSLNHSSESELIKTTIIQQPKPWLAFSFGTEGDIYTTDIFKTRNFQLNFSLWSQQLLSHDIIVALNGQIYTPWFTQIPQAKVSVSLGKSITIF